MEAISEYLYILDFFGVAVFAISGALAAGRRKLDLVGVLVAAAATAVGGGTIRDLLLDRNPIFWLDDPRYVFIILVAALATFVCARRARVPRVTIEIADTLGLALFSVTGTQIAELSGMPAVACILLGAITGAAGGVIRDVMLAQVPHILQKGSLYATAAIAGATLYMMMVRLGMEQPVASVAGIVLVALVRFAAMRWGLQLPAFEMHANEE